MAVLPTVEPPEYDITCYGTVISDTGLNVRSQPGINGTKLGTLRAGARVRVYSVQHVRPGNDQLREEWGTIEFAGVYAHIALWHEGVELTRLDPSEDCQIVAGGKG